MDDQDYAIQHTGYLLIKTAGTYTFNLSTDSGARQQIHEASVIDADSGYRMCTARSGSIILGAGLHCIPSR